MIARHLLIAVFVDSAVQGRMNDRCLRDCRARLLTKLLSETNPWYASRPLVSSRVLDDIIISAVEIENTSRTHELLNHAEASRHTALQDVPSHDLMTTTTSTWCAHSSIERL